MDNTALIDFLQSTGFVTVACNDGFTPRGIIIAIPAGISITVPYDTYQQIRTAAGLPECICDNDEPE